MGGVAIVRNVTANDATCPAEADQENAKGRSRSTGYDRAAWRTRGIELDRTGARGTTLEALDDVPRGRKTEGYGAGVYASGPGKVVDGLTVTGADKVGAGITEEGATEYPSALVAYSVTGEQPDEHTGVQQG